MASYKQSYCATNLLVLYLSLFQPCTLVNIKSVAYTPCKKYLLIHAIFFNASKFTR